MDAADRSVTVVVVDRRRRNRCACRRRCRCSRRRAGRRRRRGTRCAWPIGRLIMPSSLPPMPPWATVLSSPSTRPSVTSKLGLVGDDADRAGFARRAVERALRPGEALDAGDVVDVDVERSADRRDRLLVEIDADRRQRARSGCRRRRSRRRACRRSCTPGCGGLEADRRQLLGVVLEVRDVQLVEPPGAERLDADRHVLEILLALGRGDDDLGLVGRPARPARCWTAGGGAVTSVALVPGAGDWPVVCGCAFCAKAGRRQRGRSEQAQASARGTCGRSSNAPIRLM